MDRDFDEGVELYNYISRYCDSRYFPEVERRLLKTLRLYMASYAKSSLRHPKSGKSHGTVGTRLRHDPEFKQQCIDLCKALERRMAEFALRNHGDKMQIARCARCGAVLRTPAARQCVRCGHSWFHAAP